DHLLRSSLSASVHGTCAPRQVRVDEEILRLGGLQPENVLPRDPTGRRRPQKFLQRFVENALPHESFGRRYELLLERMDTKVPLRPVRRAQIALPQPAAAAPRNQLY